MVDPSFNMPPPQPVAQPAPARPITQPAVGATESSPQHTGLARGGKTEFVPGAYASMGHPLIDRMIDLEKALKLNRTSW